MGAARCGCPWPAFQQRPTRDAFNITQIHGKTGALTFAHLESRPAGKVRLRHGRARVWMWARLWLQEWGRARFTLCARGAGGAGARWAVWPGCAWACMGAWLLVGVGGQFVGRAIWTYKRPGARASVGVCASVCSGLFIRRGRGRRIRGLGYSVTVTKVCSWIGNGAPRRQQFPNAERFDVQIAAARRAVVHRRAMLRRTARSLKLLRCLERLYAQQALPLPCLLLI